jgi:hypothetical protein
MNTDFSFIEYSYDPGKLETSDIYESLKKLGFTRSAESINGRHTFWIQLKTILMLTEDHDIIDAGVTGIGFICDEKTIETLNPEYSESRSMYYLQDPNGLYNFLVPLNLPTDYLRIVDQKSDSLNIDYISGLTYTSPTVETLSHYEKLGFRVTKIGSRYHQLTSSNNRFTIMIDTDCKNSKIRNIITETFDVFTTTAKCYVVGLKTQHFDIDSGSLRFGNLNHLIYGYNCKAHGNEESYTIENFITQPVPNLDIIIRMRKQFIEISEHTLKEYYGSGC